MKTTIQSIVVIWLSLGWSVNSYSNPLDNTGINLLRACKNVEKIVESGKSDINEVMSSSWCIGVVMAARDLSSGFTASGIIQSDMAVCFPEGSVGNEQAIKIVIRYLEDNPHKLHLPASILAYAGLREAFPCTSENTID